MKKFNLLFLFTLAVSYTQGQQLHFHSQYMFNPYLDNPSYAGTKEYTVISASFRNQWTGFTDAPKTFTLSAHKPLSDKMGVGAAIYDDKTGPTGRTGAMGSYAYHVPFSKSYLAFGLSAMVFQYKIDKTGLTTDMPGDAAIQGGMVKQIIPEATFGMLFYSKKYYIGISIPQLLQFKVDVGSDANLNKMTRHYFVSGGYKFKLSDEIELEPSAMMKATAAAPVQVDVNAKFYYKEFLWLGASYRTAESTVIMLGASKSNFSIGYSYDITLTDIRKYSTGTHEIFLGYNLGRKKGGKAMM